MADKSGDSAREEDGAPAMMVAKEELAASKAPRKARSGHQRKPGPSDAAAPTTEDDSGRHLKDLLIKDENDSK